MRHERLGSSRGDLVRAKCLIEGLVGLGHEVLVVQDADRPGSQTIVGGYRNIVRRILPHRLALVVRDIGRLVHARAHGRAVAQTAARLNADVIIETQVGCSDSGAVAVRLTDLPLLIDDCTPSSEEGVLGAGLAWVSRQTLAKLGDAATTVVAVTEAMRNLLVVEGLEKEKIRIIPNGAFLQPLDESKRTAVRCQLSIDEAIVIGYVGSFQPWHRVDLLVEAFAFLRHLPHLHLFLMGEGVERSKVEDLVRHHDLDNRVSFHDAVPPDDVSPFVSALDIGVMPGTNPYGHPMKIIEYAAAGCVPVAPDLPVIREILDDGETGVLFTSDSTEALVAAIEELCLKGDLRRRLGAAARERVAGSASWEKRAKYLASCLDEIVQRKPNEARD